MVPPVQVDTAGGTVQVDSKASLGPLMRGAYELTTSDESLCSVGRTCEQLDLGYHRRALGILIPIMHRRRSSLMHNVCPMLARLPNNM